RDWSSDVCSSDLQTIKIPDTFTYRGFLFKKRLFRQPHLKTTHNIYRSSLLKENGRSPFAVPRDLFGSGAISNDNVAPFTNSLCLMKFLVYPFPFHFIAWI